MKKSMSKKVLSVILTLIMVISAVPLTGFQAFAEENDLGLVYGTDGTITRAEWLHDLAVVFAMSVESDAAPDNYFSDLEDTHEYYNDIILTVEFGVIDVEAGDPVYPDELVSRDFAVTTLNYCLGYQEDEGDEYVFADYEECSSPLSALVALERGWVTLVDGNFMPSLALTSQEAETMLDDALSTLEVTEINENYDSTYEFEDGVIEVPDGTEVTVSETTVTITECPVEIEQGDKFAVYQNGIPNVYTAISINTVGNTKVIAITEVETEDAFTDIDAQGIIGSGEMEFTAADGADIEVEEELEEPVSLKKSFALKSEKTPIKIKKSIKAELGLDAIPGLTGKVSAKVKEPIIKYQITSDYVYVVLEGETEISYSGSCDLASAEGIGLNKITLFSFTVYGISIDVDLKLGLSGTATGKCKGDLVAGMKCYNGGRIRLITNFQQKEYSNVIDIEAKVGLRLSIGLLHIPVVKAFIYAEVGLKANAKDTSYGDSTTICRDLTACLYFKAGAEISVSFLNCKTSLSAAYDIFNDKNSPVRIVRHYEDLIEVPACTRNGGANKYYTKYNSNFGDSCLAGSDETYGLDANGNNVCLYTYTLNSSDEATVTNYKGNAKSIRIPRTIDGYTVIGIGSSAFANKCVRVISIPEGVETIGDRAFANCTSLESISIPSTVRSTYLGSTNSYNSVLEGCTSLKECTVYYNPDFTYFYISGGGYDTYQNPYKGIQTYITKVIVPEGTTKIDKQAFKGCSALMDVTIPNSVTSIESEAFCWCNALKNVSIPDSVTSIGNSAFSACGFVNITIPNSVTSIGASAFSGCSSLTSVSIPGSVTSIGKSAFSGCKGLTNVVIPEGVETIGDYAFENCTSLESISIPSTVRSTYLGSTNSYNSVLEGCTSLKECTVYYNPDFTYFYISGGGYDTYQNPYKGIQTYITKVIVPEGTTKIDKQAFKGCSALMDVTIPNSVTSIESEAFCWCNALKNVSIPDSVTSIGNSAFSGCNSLDNLYISDNVKSIGSNAFNNCANLDILGYSDSYIEDYASRNNKTFIALDILPKGDLNEDGAVDIVDYSMAKTSVSGSQLDIISISKADYSNDRALDAFDMFYFDRAINNFGLTDFKYTVTSGNNAKITGYNATETAVKIPARIDGYTITNIDNYAFKNNSSIKSVKILEGVKTINYGAFLNCTALETVELPNTITSIGTYAFKGCSSLTKITIPASVASINANSFTDCPNVTIYGTAGSYAQTYANNNGISFVAI